MVRGSPGAGIGVVPAAPKPGEEETTPTFGCGAASPETLPEMPALNGTAGFPIVGLCRAAALWARESEKRFGVQCEQGGA